MLSVINQFLEEDEIKLSRSADEMQDLGKENFCFVNLLIVELSHC
jgi:hypothetical protein